MLLFPPGMHFPSSPPPSTSPKALLTLRCHLLWEVFINASQSHEGVCGLILILWWHLVRISVITPATVSVHLEQGVCSVSVCWVGRDEGAEKSGAREPSACMDTWKKAISWWLCPQDCLEGAPWVGEYPAARDLGAEQGPLSQLEDCYQKLCGSQCPHFTPPPFTDLGS